jgi:hypothetical protein
MSSSTNTIINPKPCNYGCNTRIYWNTSENAYFEVFTKQKHVCKNRTMNNNNNVSKSSSYIPKAKYYNKFSKESKPKMSNSLELLSGPIDSIQKKYEILSDIVNEYNGKVHGSQSHIVANNSISLVVYYEVPEGKREEVKQRFNKFFSINVSFISLIYKGMNQSIKI